MEKGLRLGYSKGVKLPFLKRQSSPSTYVPSSNLWKIFLPLTHFRKALYLYFSPFFLSVKTSHFFLQLCLLLPPCARSRVKLYAQCCSKATNNIAYSPEMDVIGLGRRQKVYCLNLNEVPQRRMCNRIFKFIHFQWWNNPSFVSSFYWDLIKSKFLAEKKLLVLLPFAFDNNQYPSWSVHATPDTCRV